MPKPHQSIRLFKNDWMEKYLTHIHPATPAVMWVPVVLWLMWRAFSVHGLGPVTVGSLFAAGFVSWTFAEYTLHRFVFHFQPNSKIQERLQYILHGLHHDDPIDPTRLVMPPALAVIFSAILYSLFRYALGPVLVEPFFAAFLVGYLCYDYIHYYVHHFTPTTKIGKFLKQSHMMHHYVSHESRWGVSSPLWDYVFGTLEAEKEQPTA